MRYDITCQTAFLRHPDEACQLLLKVNKSRKRAKKPLLSKEDLAWSYQVAECISASTGHLPKECIGRAYLEGKLEDLFISLGANPVGRQPSTIDLDNKALLAGPDSSLPVEVLGASENVGAPKLWLWQPFDDSAPGWQAWAVNAASSVSSGALLEISRGRDSKKVLFDGKNCLSSLMPETGKAAKEKTSHVVDPALVLAAHLSKVNDFKCKLLEPSTQDLIALLSKSRGFSVMTIGGQSNGAAAPLPDRAHDQPEPSAAARHFDYGQCLSEQERTSLADLLLSNTPAVMNFADMLSTMAARASANPPDRRQVCLAIAQGEPVAAVIARFGGLQGDPDAVNKSPRRTVRKVGSK